MKTTKYDHQNTYEYDDKVQYRPEAGEVLGKPQGDPLEQHLDDKDQTEDKVGPVEDLLEPLVLVQVDVLEAERDAGRKDQHQHEPLEGGRVDVLQDGLPKSVPALAKVGLETVVPALASEEDGGGGVGGKER